MAGRVPHTLPWHRNEALIVARGAACEAIMRKNNKILLDAEGQLVFGTTLGDMRSARDELRHVLPGCLLLDLLEAKIARVKRADWTQGVNSWRV